MHREERARAIVVGASSGIGAALARELAREGYAVALVARRAELLRELAREIERAHGAGRAHVYAHDVRHVREVAPLFERIVEDLHGLDLLVYAAGIMPAIAPDEYDAEKDRAIVETNLTGAMAWGDEAARWLASARAGTIVGISSMAGERGRRGHPAYCASKAGLNTWLESLRGRLAPAGVRVVTVKPGFVRTGMLEGRGRLPWVIETDEAARRIASALRGGAQVVYVPRRWRFVGWVLRALPGWALRRIPF
jgi:short-subunit dehydrogenase